MVLTSVVIHGGTVGLFHIGITSHQSWRNDIKERKRRATESQSIDPLTNTVTNSSADIYESSGVSSI